jgi:glutamyl-tRNA reductase
MQLVVVGLSHRTAPVALREKVAFSADECEDLLLSANSADELPERLLLSTCNRTELYALAEVEGACRKLFLKMVKQHRGVDLERHPEVLYEHSGEQAVRHLFRVAAAIDSMVVGEVQILGQVHQAFAIAHDVGSTGPIFHRLMNGAFRAGKRSRRETEVAAGAISVAFAAVTLTRKIFSDLEHRTALLVGSGETAELAAQHLKSQQIGNLLVTNRTHRRALALAQRLGGEAVEFSDLKSALARASIVVSATTSSTPLIGVDLVKSALGTRGNRSLLVLDIAVPRDVEPEVGRLPNVFLYDIDALEELVQHNLEHRAEEIPKVEAIVHHETDKFMHWFASRDTVPTIRDLRECFEHVRARQVERHKHKFCPRDQRHLDALTRGIINKLLHEPTVALRDLDQEEPASASPLDTVRRLFGLSGGRDAESD